MIILDLDSKDPPPRYSTISSSSKPLPRIPPPPTKSSANNLNVVRSEHPIKGSWSVDTSLPTSSPPPSPGRPNIRLVAHQGGIHATVTLKGHSKATLHAISNNGPVTFCIPSRNHVPFSLLIQVQSGDCQVYLPRSFYGPIHCKWKRPESNHKLGTTSFAPIFTLSMEPFLTALSSFEDPSGQHDTNSVFLGDLSARNDMQSPETLEWNADEISIELDHKGKAFFFWADDSAIEVETSTKTFKDRLAPLQKALGPLVAKARRKASDDE